MSAILSITAPIYLLIALGAMLRHIQLFTREEFRAYARLAVNLCLPALLFDALTRRPIGEILNVPVMAAYTLGSLVAFAIGYFWAIRRGEPMAPAALHGAGVSCSNSGFIGYAIVSQALGPVAGVSLTLVLMIENLVMLPLLLAVAEAGMAKAQREREAAAGAGAGAGGGAAGGGSAAVEAAGRHVDAARASSPMPQQRGDTADADTPANESEHADAMEAATAGASGTIAWAATRARSLAHWAPLRTLVRSPLILAIVAGLVVSLLEIPVSGALRRVINLLGSAASPIALITIGGSLAGVSLAGQKLELGRMVLLKLLGHPLLVGLAMLAIVPAIGRLEVAAILHAAMPMMSMLPLLAMRFGDERFCAAAVVAATSASFITLSLAVWLLNNWQPALEALAGS